MGLISFVKNAGAKLFKKKAVPQTENTSVEVAEPTQAELDAQKAVELEGLIKSLGFDIEDLYIEVNDDVAVVHGKTASWDEKEKVALACGNVEGIAQVDDRIEIVEAAVEEEREVPAEFASAEPASSEYYTVQKGDSLSKISKRVYGNALKYRIIFEANRPMLSDPNRIYPGQVLRIPSIEEA